MKKTVRERRSTAQSFQRTQIVMDLLYLKTPLRYKSDIRLHETYTYLRTTSDGFCLFCLWFFHNRVPGKWNGKRRVLTILGTKSKICFLGRWIYSHDSPSHLTFMFLYQQLSANGCWTARGRWNHMGKWWAPDWEHELQIERWYDRLWISNLTLKLNWRVVRCSYQHLISLSQ